MHNIYPYKYRYHYRYFLSLFLLLLQIGMQSIFRDNSISLFSLMRVVGRGIVVIRSQVNERKNFFGFFSILLLYAQLIVVPEIRSDFSQIKENGRFFLEARALRGEGKGMAKRTFLKPPKTSPQKTLPLSSRGWGGKALVAGPLNKITFLRLSLYKRVELKQVRLR